MSRLDDKSLRLKKMSWIGLAGILVVVVGVGVAFFTTRSGPPSGGSIPQVSLLAPHDGATLPVLRRFVWQRIPSSTAYHFFLYEVNRTLVWSTLVRDTSLTILSSVELQRGRAYLWRVEAILPGETTLRSDLRAFTLSQ